MGAMRGERTIVALMALMLLVPATTACISSSGPATPQAIRTSAPSEAASPATTGASVPASAGSPAPEGGASDNGPLAPALLTLNDLPAGWIVVPPSAAEANDPTRGAFLCGAGDQVPGALQQSDIHFHDSARGAILYDTAATYAPGAAKQGLDKIADALKTCTTWTADNGGVSGTFSVTPVRLPERGDQTVAFRLVTMNANGKELGMMDVVMTRHQDAISTISLFNASSERLDKDTDTYAELAEQRLAKVLGVPATKFTIGNTVKLTDGSSVTVHSLNTHINGPAFQGKTAAVIDAEVCAGPKPVEGTSQYNFSLELANQSIGEQIGSIEGYQELPSGDLAAGQCARGYIATAFPTDQQPKAVTYAITNPSQSGVTDQISWEVS